MQTVAAYVRRIEAEWKTGSATEHSYRPMLKELVEALLPRVTALNEPRHIVCGAPDYLLRRGADILGFIEAKDLGAGDGMVTGVKVVGVDEQRKVYINKSQWFEPVPEGAWIFSIGGYQPAQKWLKDRKGRVLTADDRQHYRAIVAALVKTGALMKELEG